MMHHFSIQMVTYFANDLAYIEDRRILYNRSNFQQISRFVLAVWSNYPRCEPDQWHYVLINLIRSVKRVITDKQETTLNHWGRVTHICVGKLPIIASDNGLSPGRLQAIIWANIGILLIGPLGQSAANFL